MEEKLVGTVDVNAVYDQIIKIDIPLEIQHNYNGPYIDTKVVECNTALDMLDKLITNVTRELTNYEIRRNIVEEEITNKKRNELTNNDELRKKYGTGKEREIAVEMMLKDNLTERSSLDRHILNLENLLTVVKTKYSNISKKAASVKDQFRRMTDLVTSGGVPMTPDKDTALLLKTLKDVEVLEDRAKEFDEENVGEIEEYIEKDLDQDATGSDALPSQPEPGSQSTDVLDIEIGSDVVPESAPSSVTQAESSVIVGAFDEVIVLDSDESNTSSKSPAPAEQESVTPEEDASSEEDSELDMDTVLDGLDQENESEVLTEEVVAGKSTVSSVSAEEGNEDLVLEDIFSNDAVVVTEEPAKLKPGQGEPTSKEKNPKKESPKAAAPPEKKKEDTAVKGDVDIDNILDMI